VILRALPENVKFPVAVKLVPEIVEDAATLVGVIEPNPTLIVPDAVTGPPDDVTPCEPEISILVTVIIKFLI
jgi:hypothetical protein